MPRFVNTTRVARRLFQRLFHRGAENKAFVVASKIISCILFVRDYPCPARRGLFAESIVVDLAQFAAELARAQFKNAARIIFINIIRRNVPPTRRKRLSRMTKVSRDTSVSLVLSFFFMSPPRVSGSNAGVSACEKLSSPLSSTLSKSSSRNIPNISARYYEESRRRHAERKS